MSQDLRTYELARVDGAREEANRLSITATVGPTPEDTNNTRGVQVTLDAPQGFAYARLSEAQIQDLIGVLKLRIDSEMPYEATGIKATDTNVKPDGEIE